MTAKTIERRVSDLELDTAEGRGPLLLPMDDASTEQARAAIQAAARVGRPVVAVSEVDERL